MKNYKKVEKTLVFYLFFLYYIEKQMKTIYETMYETAKNAPSLSGVYLWKNKENTILYVGKAKNLKNRLSSYFSGKKDTKTRILISKATSIEYITTTNEYEALILENTLIKQHRPRYNIDLKDDKSYPMIRITNDDFPRILKTRRIIQDGSSYFGPFPNAGALTNFIDLVDSLYSLRKCKKMPRNKKPCMYYHIDRCPAPCADKISTKSYNDSIGEIKSFLEKNPQRGILQLEKKMKTAAKNLQFEKAGKIRDGIAALKMLRSQNTVTDFSEDSRDYIGFYAEGSRVSFTVLKMRGGKLVMKDTYRTQSLKDDDELLAEFIPAYYTEIELIPPRIFVKNADFLALAEQWIFNTYKIKTSIISPKQVENNKRHESSLAMAYHNAKEDSIRWLREKEDINGLKELKKILNLKNLPIRIEGFDIAHLGGTLPVASLVSFYKGNPDKKKYRYFRLKTTDGIIDDFASMREVTSRRYTRLLNEEAELPDLLLIDGGIGQVNAVQEILDALELDIPVVGLAKREEELYRPGNSTPIVLNRRNDGLRLLQRVRDETHRFATSRNQRLRTKEKTTSIFTALPDIGPKRAKKILETWGDFETLSKAETNAIAKTLKISEVRAKDIKAVALKTLNVSNQENNSAEYKPLEVTDNKTLLAAEKTMQYTKNQH